MARRRKHVEHVNHDRWLVSYADFITLLFAFFVVMFAVSQVDAKKLGRFTQSVQRATSAGIFEHGGGASPISTGAGAGRRVLVTEQSKAGAEAKGRASLEVLKERLTKSLSAAIDSHRIEIVQSGEGLVVRLRDGAFFDSASAEIRPELLTDLSRVGLALGETSHAIRIEGHTDSLPIRNAVYRSNWELSAARAASVLSYLVDSANVAEGRLSVSGYASQRPLASNDAPQGRSQNRRVDIVVLGPIADPSATDATQP